MKYKLKTLDGLSDEQKALYKACDDGFVLNIEGMPEPEDTAGLKAKNEALLAEKKAEADKRKKAEKEAQDAADAKAREKGDHESLLKSAEATIAELRGDIKTRDETAATSARDRVAMELAAELSEGHNQKILSRFISDRLRYEDGAVKVTDENGNLTISTVDQLKEEFKNNDSYASLVIGSRASGGGAGGNNGGGAATKFSDLSEKERVDLYKRSPEEYQAAKSAE